MPAASRRDLSGQPIVAHLALKADLQHHSRALDRYRRRAGGHDHKGRHDPCVGIRATPIAEAMMAIVLLDQLLRQRGQNADVRVDTPVLPQL